MNCPECKCQPVSTSDTGSQPEKTQLPKRENAFNPTEQHNQRDYLLESMKSVEAQADENGLIEKWEEIWEQSGKLAFGIITGIIIAIICLMMVVSKSK